MTTEIRDVAALAPAWDNYFRNEVVTREWTEADEMVVQAAQDAGERDRGSGKLRLRLHPDQWKTIHARERFIFVIAGSGGGKTIFAPRWMYVQIKRRELLPVEDQTYLVFAPSYKVLKRATLPAYIRLFHAMRLGVFKRGDLVYELRNGGRIHFGSCDNPESLEGVHPLAAHGDEIGQTSVSAEVWETVRRRLGFHEGRFLGTTTPYNMGWLKQQIVDPWTEGRAPDTTVISFPSSANPMYSRDELALLKATLPAWKYDMFYGGLFARAEGLIFPIFDAERHIETPFTIPAGWNRYAGQDFGLRHPTASVFGTLDPRPYPNDVLHLYGEYRQSERSTPEHVKDIKALATAFSDKERAAKLKKMWADPRSVQLIADYKAAGLPIEPAHAGPGSVKATIQEVYTRLKENADDGLPRLRLFRGMLPGWIDEVDDYSWAKDAAGNPTDVPVEYADDEMDCTRYLCDGVKAVVHSELPPLRAPDAPIAAGMWNRPL
jgi:hypothetical protein